MRPLHETINEHPTLIWQLWADKDGERICLGTSKRMDGWKALWPELERIGCSNPEYRLVDPQQCQNVSTLELRRIQ